MREWEGNYCRQCGSPYVERHHAFFGNPNRKLSEKYGLVVYLCGEHHKGNYSPHRDITLDREIKREAQRKFEEEYSHKKFMEVFGRNYL